MKVLAIDPGFGRCGVSVLEGSGSKAALLYSSCIETEAKSEFSQRMLFVANEVIRLIDKYSPDTIAIEEIYVWAFTKTEEGWTPNSTIPLSDEDGATLSILIEELEGNDEVQDVYTNAE